MADELWLAPKCGSKPLSLALAIPACAPAQTDAGPPVKAGVDVLLEDGAALLDGLRVGLITNHTGVTLDGRSTIDTLAALPNVQLVALFGPETPTLYAPLRTDRAQRHVVHYKRLACSPCMFVHDNKVLSCWFAQAKCMTGITPGEVLASVEALLDRTDAGRVAALAESRVSSSLDE